MEKFQELSKCVESIEKDANKFFSNGNKAAGTRARKHLQELKQLAQELRVLIQDTKNEKISAAASAKVDDPGVQPTPYEDEHDQVGF